MFNEVLVDLFLMRHFPQIRGAGIGFHDIGFDPSADCRAWFPADILDFEQAIPLAEAFVAQHSNVLHTGALLFHPGTMRGLQSACLILHIAGIKPESWETQLVCEPGLWTFNPSKYCYEDGRNYTMMEFRKDKSSFVFNEGIRVGEVFKNIAIKIAECNNFQHEHCIGFCIGHGGPIDTGLADIRVALGFNGYDHMVDIEKGEIIKIPFNVSRMGRNSKLPSPVAKPRADDYLDRGIPADFFADLYAQKEPMYSKPTETIGPFPRRSEAYQAASDRPDAKSYGIRRVEL